MLPSTKLLIGKAYFLILFLLWRQPRSYASNCEQLLKSHKYLEGVRMHQRSVGKILADSRPATGFGSVPVTYGPRDRNDHSGRFLRRESVP